MIRGEDFVSLVAQGDEVRTLQIISDMKTQIKRYLVEISDVPSYIIGLKHAYYQAQGLEISAFTTLCHLITRVSMQDPQKLSDFTELVLPFLLERLADARQPVAQTAKKSLKTFWTCISSSDERFITTIYQSGFQNYSNYKVQLDLLGILNSLLVDTGFGFKYYMNAVVELLSSPNEEVANMSFEVLLTFFQRVNPNSKNAKMDLINLLQLVGTNKSIALKLLNQIGGIELVNEYNNGDSENTNIGYDASMNNDISTNPTFISDELNSKLNEIQYWRAEQHIEIVSFDYSLLIQMEESIVKPFEGKETDLNWKDRQNWITKLRGMVRFINNDPHLSQLLSDFMNGVKECIVKAMSSLRTTLSTNAFQLCKEIGISLGTKIDQLTFELLASSLIKLCNVRKSIQHMNANVGMIGLIINCNLSYKYFQMLMTCMQEKNAQPKVYIGQWVHMLFLKYYNSAEDFESLNEFVEPILVKGLSDYQPQVRESMRVAYWCLNNLSPSHAQQVRQKLDSNTLRALDKCVPQFGAVDSFRKFDNIKSQRDKLTNVKKPEVLAQFDTNVIRESSKRSISLDQTSLTAKRTFHPRSQSLEKPKYENEDITEWFNKQTIILEELTSNSNEIQEQGFMKLLEFNNDKEMNYNLRVALNKLTYTNPLLFKPIFSDAQLFKKMNELLFEDNIIRLFCIHFENQNGPSRDEIDLIFNTLKLEDICLNIDSIMKNCENIVEINDLKVSVQYNKYKETIMKVCLLILRDLFIFKHAHLKAYLLSGIFESLNLALPLIDNDKELKSIYDETLRIAYNKWSDEYVRSLAKCSDRANHREICIILGIPNDDNETEEHQKGTSVSVYYDEGDDDDDDEEYAKSYNLEQMTKLMPRQDVIFELIQKQQEDQVSEEEENIEDFTKIVPPKQGYHGDEVEKIFELIEEDPREDPRVDHPDSDAQMVTSKEGSKHEDETPEPGEEGENEEEEEEGKTRKADITATEVIEETYIQHPSQIINLEDDQDDYQESQVTMGHVPDFTEELSQIGAEGSNDDTDSTPDLQKLDIDEAQVKYQLLNNWHSELEINSSIYEDLFRVSNEQLNLEISDDDDQCAILAFWESKGLIEEIMKICKSKSDWCSMAYFLLEEIFNKHLNSVELLADKINYENRQYWSLVLGRLLEIVSAGQVSVEDVFFLERILRRGVNENDTDIRMKTFRIYSKLYQKMINKDVNENGYEIVDSLLFEGLDTRILQKLIN